MGRKNTRQLARASEMTEVVTQLELRLDGPGRLPIPVFNPIVDGGSVSEPREEQLATLEECIREVLSGKRPKSDPLARWLEARTSPYVRLVAAWRHHEGGAKPDGEMLGKELHSEFRRLAGGEQPYSKLVAIEEWPETDSIDQVLTPWREHLRAKLTSTTKLSDSKDSSNGAVVVKQEPGKKQQINQETPSLNNEKLTKSGAVPTAARESAEEFAKSVGAGEGREREVDMARTLGEAVATLLRAKVSGSLHLLSETSRQDLSSVVATFTPPTPTIATRPATGRAVEEPVRTAENLARRNQLVRELGNAPDIETARSYLKELKAVLAERRERACCWVCKKPGNIQVKPAGVRNKATGQYSTLQFEVRHSRLGKEREEHGQVRKLPQNITFTTTT